MKALRLLSLWICILVMIACDSIPTSPSSSNSSGGKLNPISEIKEVVRDATTATPPARINGRELMTLRGWHANLYSAWSLDMSQASVYPVPELYTPGQTQNPDQIKRQERQLNEYGSAADVWMFDVDKPVDNDYWIRTFFPSSSRPFYLLIGPADGIINTDDPSQRKKFIADIDFIFKNIVAPFSNRYVTVDGKAIIYIWNTSMFVGNLPSLLDEVRKIYPVFFMGSEGSNGDNSRLKSLDGVMFYSVAKLNNYKGMVQDYYGQFYSIRRAVRKIQAETGKKILLVPTFVAAYDARFVPGRSGEIMYPRSREEMEFMAQMIRDGMSSGIWDNIGPFVMGNEVYEGGAVIESQCRPDIHDQLGRYVGCGKARLEILKKYFW